jgi:protein-disulfide isomerase
MNSGETKLFLGILVVAIVLAAVAIYPAMVAARNEPQGPVVIVDPKKAKVTRADLFPKGSWFRGNPKAPHMLVEFADYQCPLCATSVEEVKKILSKQGDRFCYVFHGIQINRAHLNAPMMAQAAEAAGLQGKFWPMHEMLFKSQRLFTGLPEVDAVDTVNKLARDVGLDMMRFGADFQGDRAVKGQERSGKIAVQADVQTTPTFFIVPPKGPTLKLQSLRELIAWFDKPGNLK